MECESVTYVSCQERIGKDDADGASGGFFTGWMKNPV